MGFRNRISDLFMAGAARSWVSVTTVRIGRAGKICEMRDSTDSADIVFSGTLDADITISGAGGLRAALVEAANTWYAVHAIADTTGVNPVKLFLDTSHTAPVLPAGYDVFRHVFWVRNNGSSNLRKLLSTGSGNRHTVTYDEERTNVQPLALGAATVWTTVLFDEELPPTAMRAETMVGFNSATPNDTAQFRTKGSTVAAPPTFVRVGLAVPTAVTAFVPLNTDASQQIQYINSNAGALTDLYVVGYEDEL